MCKAVRGATKIKTHTFVASERHDKLRKSYRSSATASDPSPPRLAEHAVNHDTIVDNVTQKDINESSPLFPKILFHLIKDKTSY